MRPLKLDGADVRAELQAAGCAEWQPVFLDEEAFYHGADELHIDPGARSLAFRLVGPSRSTFVAIK